jgi:hypothetical protein
MKILIIHRGKQIRRFRQGNCFGKERFQDFDTERFKSQKMIVSGRIAFSGDKNYAIEKESSLVLTIDFCSQMKILRKTFFRMIYKELRTCASLSTFCILSDLSQK